MESSDDSIQTVGLRFVSSDYENSGTVPVTEHCEANVDERKRKQNNPIPGATKKVKIENSSSLGLSLLQTYDEDIQDDYAESVDVVADDKNCNVSHSEKVARESNFKTEKISAGSAIDDNLSYNSDSCAAKTTFSFSRKVIDDTTLDTAKTLSSENELDEQIRRGNFQNPPVADTPKVSSVERSIKKSSTNYDESSFVKSYSVEETSVKRSSANESMNPFHYKTFSTIDEVYTRNELAGEKSCSKPVKKVKLNRSKFFRPADESSNDYKFLPTANLSNECKSSGTTDFSDECKSSLMTAVNDKSRNYSDSISSDSAASNDIGEILENVDSVSKIVFGKMKADDEFSTFTGACKSPARFHIVDELLNSPSSNNENATSSFHSVKDSQSHRGVKMNSEITTDAGVTKNHFKLKTTSKEENVLLTFTNDNLLDHNSRVISEPNTVLKVQSVDEKDAISLDEVKDKKLDNDGPKKLQAMADDEDEDKIIASEFSSLIVAPMQDNEVIENEKETVGNEVKEDSFAIPTQNSKRMENQKTCEKPLQEGMIATVIDSSDDMANDEKLTFEDPVEARDNGSSDEEIFRDAMETVESESEENIIKDSNVESSGNVASEYESNKQIENTMQMSTSDKLESKTKVDESVLLKKLEGFSTEQALEEDKAKLEQNSEKVEKISQSEQTSEKSEEPFKLEQALEIVKESAKLEQTLEKFKEPTKFKQTLEKFDDFLKPEQTLEKNEEPSKLEQALTGKIESSHCSTFKKIENVVGSAREKRPTNSVVDEAARYVVNVTEAPGSKENIKLHISLQGNRASIKKTKEMEPNAVPQAVSSSVVETSILEPPPRIKRKYTKRAKVIMPETADSDEKTYKLRTRNARKQSEKNNVVPATTTKKAGKDTISSLSEPRSVDKFITPKVTDNKLSISPMTIAIDRLSESKIQSAGGSKVPAIKLKISKSSGMTATEITSKPVPVTQEKIEMRADDSASPVSNQIAQFLEQARKKDSISTFKSTEQGACAWSGKDLQRVERLLKESNVTITPVTCSSPRDPVRNSSILKPILTEDKQRSTSKMSGATASPLTTTLPPVSALVTHSAIPSTSTSREDIVATSVWPQSAETLNPIPAPETKTRNFNVILKPLDLEDKIRHWKVAKSNCDQININDDIGPDKLDVNGAATVDVKTEIRRKIASAERRKQEANGSDSIGFLDAKGLSTTSSSGGKTLPDLLPISNSFGSENSICVTPTDDKSITLIGESPTTDVVDAKLSELNNTSVLYPVLPPAMFPKKRGRPTKAMVAARNAYRQSQEALENLKRQNLPVQQPSDDSNLSPHFLIPLVDVSSGEQTDQTSGSPQTPLKNKRGRKPKERFETGSNSDYSANDGSVTQSTILDPEREMEEIKRLDEERIRKEQERERKNELRRQKARERSDLVKAKRLRQKMKAEERQKRMQEQKRLLQEEKKKLEEEIKKLPATVGGFDGSGNIHEKCSQLQNNSFSIDVDDDFNSTMIDLNQRIKKSRMEVIDSEKNDLTVDQIAEYQWPIQGGELYMIQEQISNFLGVKSFKRKYPDIKRRPVDSEERAYLVDSGLVSETLCDLGITAVCCAEVLDIMCSDFPEKYEELRKYMREKQMKEMTFKQKAWANGLGYKLLMADGTKQDLKKRAMESASNWNSALNKSRGEDRRCAMDLQTFIIHYPKNKAQKMTAPSPKVGSYPISILPGQFSDFYKEYTCTELRYMPLNTVLYGPLKHPEASSGADGSQTDSDDSSSSDESSSTTSESTQATEETVEDVERDVSMSMTLDESTTSQLAEKLQDVADVLSKDEEEVARREMLNGMRETLTAADDDSLKELCKICLGDHSRNKENVPEVLIRCSQCTSTSHPTCLDLSLNMVSHIRSYKWQCPDCKSCARCKENADEDKMLFCDNCDRGYHIYCVGLKKVPSGSWQCQECVTVDNVSVPNNMSVTTRVEAPRDPITVKEET